VLTVLAFYFPIVATLAFDGLLLVLLTWAFHATRFAALRISLAPSMKVSRSARLKNIAVSSMLSLVLVFGLPYLVFEATFYAGPVAAVTLIWQVLAILLIYDFAYYWLHRAMHHKRLMRLVHGVHHRVHNPTALESFYLHPAELFAGLALLIACTWLVGPVHGHAFAIVFFIHSTLNILVHAGLRFRHPLLLPIDHLARKHHVHHMDDFDKNYASLTPFPDMLFGTRS